MPKYLSYERLQEYDALIKALIPKKVSDLTNDIVFPVTSVNGQTGAVNLPIPAAAKNGTLTIKQNETSKGTFSADQSTNATIELTDTTYTAGTGLTLNGTTFLVKTGYTPNGKNYAVTADANNNLYVNVPWENTTNTADVDKATSSSFGIVKVGSNISVSGGEISLSTSNVTSALGFTPVKTDDFDAYKTTIEGSVSTVSTNLTNHVNNKSNPHGVTISQIGAAPAILYQTNDPGAGSSLATGTLLCVYEA